MNAAELRQAWASGPVEDELRERLITRTTVEDVPAGQVVELLREIGDLRRRLHPLYYELSARDGR